MLRRSSTPAEAGTSAPTRAPGQRQAEREVMLIAELPTDVLEAIIQQTLGMQELCALEAVCKLFRSLIDDRSWRQVMCHQRRGTVLREPACWKKELMRRELWSHDWRKIVGCSSPSKMRLSQRLKNMITLGAMPRRRDTLVVDPTGAPGTFATIGAALLHVKAFDVVLIMPGEYRDNNLKIGVDLELVGSGPIGSVTVCGLEGPVIELVGRVSCRIANVVIKQLAKASAGLMSSAVLVKGGASLVVEESYVRSDIGHCIVIQGVGSYGHILHNEVADSKGVGVLVCDQARAVIEDNDISNSGRAGVAILSGGDPVVRFNRIRDGMDSGVLASEKGRGRIEDNDICGNRRAGVAILKEGAPLVQRNLIHSGRDSGVLVCENGHGSVIDNEIYANQVAGVAIGRGGASRVTGNRIRDGSGGSLCLSQHSKGIISDNVIHQQPNAQMQVPEELIGALQNQNVIRVDVEPVEADPKLRC